MSKDAIFSAARYLHAAGAAQKLGKAIFAYNHAGWYVQSVLLRAKLVGGMPAPLIGALSGLVQGHFPVAARATYADDQVEALATRRVHGANAAIAIGSDHSTGVNIFAAKGAPVIKRFDEQRWVLDNVIEANGVDWDQSHTGVVIRSGGPSTVPDMAELRRRVKRLVDIGPHMAAV